MPPKRRNHTQQRQTRTSGPAKQPTGLPAVKRRKGKETAAERKARELRQRIVDAEKEHEEEEEEDNNDEDEENSGRSTAVIPRNRVVVDDDDDDENQPVARGATSTPVPTLTISRSPSVNSILAAETPNSTLVDETPTRLTLRSSPPLPPRILSPVPFPGLATPSSQRTLADVENPASDMSDFIDRVDNSSKKRDDRGAHDTLSKEDLAIFEKYKIAMDVLTLTEHPFADAEQLESSLQRLSNSNQQYSPELIRAFHNNATTFRSHLASAARAVIVSKSEVKYGTRRPVSVGYDLPEGTSDAMARIKYLLDDRWHRHPDFHESLRGPFSAIQITNVVWYQYYKAVTCTGFKHRALVNKLNGVTIALVRAFLQTGLISERVWLHQGRPKKRARIASGTILDAWNTSWANWEQRPLLVREKFIKDLRQDMTDVLRTTQSLADEVDNNIQGALDNELEELNALRR